MELHCNRIQITTISNINLQMKKIIITFFTLGLIVSCTSLQTKESINKYESFAQIFNEIDTVLDRDNGTFWNHSLKGPILLVNPETREFISNQNSKSEEFQKYNDVYIGTIPNEVNIANTAKNWDGKRWTMVLLPLPKDKKARDNLIIHELFHRIQPQIGFNNLYEKSNAHLDSFNGRLLLKLELEALVHAVYSIEKVRITHLGNALRFRKERQTSNEIKNEENTLELKEGLAEYTGVMLSDRSPEELKLHFRSKVDQFYNNKTFVRSFAYHTVPMYGYLLSQIKENWHREITEKTNLTDYFKNSFSLNMDSTRPYETIAKENNYHFEKFQKAAQLREKKQLKIIANYKELFLNKPTLKLMLKNMRISFNPRNIIPIKNIGTVYPTIRVTDNWGIFTAKKGALVSADWKNIIVSEPKEINDSIIKGDGWKLELKKNWKVEKTTTNYELKKKK